MAIKFSDKEKEVFRNIISGVESGGLEYGKGDYAAFAEAYENSSTEYAITLGKWQAYGPEAHELVARIQKNYPSVFKKLDTANIAGDLAASDWSYYQLSRSSDKAKCIIKIISSPEGKKCQEEQFDETVQKLHDYVYSLGITDHQAIAMASNWAYQGGLASVSRILKKTDKPYNLDNLYAACQTDTNPSYVGYYKNRQRCVYTWIKQYWPSETKEVTSSAIINGSQNKPTKGETKMTYASGSIANSGHDENYGYSGGVAGDQTGNEWEVRSFYIRPWDCVLRYPNAEARATAARLGIDAANNNHIGYDQYQRTTFWTQLTKVGYEPSKITVDCEQDCSAGVSAIWKATGYLMNIQALKAISENNWTGSMKSAFRAAGFEVLTASKYLTSADYLLAGDVLLNEAAHTALVVVSGSKSGETTNNSNISNTSPISDSSSGTLNNTVKSWLYAKKDNTKLRVWGGEDEDQLVSYPTVDKGTKLGLCDSIKVDGRDWYFVKISGSKGDKWGFVDSYDVSNNISDVQKTETNVIVSGVPMTLSNGKTFNTSKRKWIGRVNTGGDTLNFRTWAGTDSEKLKSIPEIPDGKKVYVYDALLDDNGKIWLYIKYKNKWGFVYSDYIIKI